MVPSDAPPASTSRSGLLPERTGFSFLKPAFFVKKPSLIRYEQMSETTANTIINTATEYTLPDAVTSTVQISGVMPPKMAASW